MGPGSEDGALATVEELARLTAVARRLSALTDTSVLARQAAREAHTVIGTEFTSVAVRERRDLLAMRGVFGGRTEESAKLRIRTGAGIGGKILQVKKPVTVADYEHDPSITSDFVDVVVHGEGIGGMTGVPIEFRGEILGVVYAAIRSIGHIGDRLRSRQTGFAASLAPLLASTMQTERSRTEAISAERQRIGIELHDTVGQSLFGIGAAARRARAQVGDRAATDLLAELEEIEAQASRAASGLRDALSGLAPCSNGSLTGVVRFYAEQFSQRSAIPVQVIALGDPVNLAPEAERLALAIVREALLNAHRHAGASSAVVTVSYEGSDLSVIVQDDGRGPDPDLIIERLPTGRGRWGLASLARRLGSLGGRLELIANEDGGATVRASVPAEGVQ